MNKKHKDGLIIFIKNPVLGKAKTRLAKGIGDEAALKVYIKLLDHTREETLKVPSTRYLYYSDEIKSDDAWSQQAYIKRNQAEGDLGARMQAAFSEVLNECEKAIIVGSDCPEITNQIIQSAIKRLELADVVLGPAEDGGYYLLGMKLPHKFLFEDLPWSTKGLLNETIRRIQEEGLLYTLLPELSDLDNVDDLNRFPSFGE